MRCYLSAPNMNQTSNFYGRNLLILQLLLKFDFKHNLNPVYTHQNLVLNTLFKTLYLVFIINLRLHGGWGVYPFKPRALKKRIQVLETVRTYLHHFCTKQVSMYKTNGDYLVIKHI